MSNGYLIEINDLDAGLLIREGNAFAFLAMTSRFRALEGKMFSSPHEAERAAWKGYRECPRKARPLH